MHGGGKGRERGERESQVGSILRAEPGSRSHNPEIIPELKSRVRGLTKPSHPGASNFMFYLILADLNFSSHTWLVTTVFDNTAKDPLI